MTSNEEQVNPFREYFGFDGRALVTFFSLVAGVLVVVTGIYVAIFGLDNWKSSMSQAGSMMLSNFNDTNGAGAGINNPGVPAAMGAAQPSSPVGVQFSCPNCGAVGLPNWSQQGAPLCPNCGNVMNVTGPTGGKSRLAAAP